MLAVYFRSIEFRLMPPSCPPPCAVETALLAAMRARDPACGEHCDRVTRLALALGRRSGMSARELVPLASAARLHDLGKIGIPDGILHKPGRLDAAEWEVMREHPVIGERLVREARPRHATEVAALVRWHHEHFDGSGYPDGLRGHEIPLAARILTVCDVYDALGETRVYRPALEHDRILAIMADEAGTLTDPLLFQRLDQAVCQDGALASS